MKHLNLMKRLFKRTVGVLLVCAVLMVLIYQWVFRTATGSHWAIDFVSERWLPALSYQDMAGTLSQGI